MRSFNGFFFFSCRRRHTRWPRDLSSDVCSSDLGGQNASNYYQELALSMAIKEGGIEVQQSIDRLRSEERRVGKESNGQLCKGCREDKWRDEIHPRLFRSVVIPFFVVAGQCNVGQ